jgi:hypothetical protein
LYEGKQARRSMKIETFFKRFNNRVINNHLARNAPFSGHMFETYGKELKFVKSQPEECVFTLIEESGRDEGISTRYLSQEATHGSRKHKEDAGCDQRAA